MSLLMRDWLLGTISIYLFFNLFDFNNLIYTEIRNEREGTGGTVVETTIQLSSAIAVLLIILTLKMKLKRFVFIQTDLFYFS